MHLRFSWGAKPVVVAFALALPLSLVVNAQPDEPNQIPRDLKQEDVDRLMAQWEKSLTQKVAKDPVLGKLGTKYPHVVLHSRALVKGGAYMKSGYNFVHRTADPKVHQDDVQLLFDNGAGDNTFSINMSVEYQNLLADLGNVDFMKDPDLKKITLDGKGINCWDPTNCKAVENHVYVERVRDIKGTKFYVLFKVLTHDPQSRYTAFVWRLLPPTHDAAEIPKDFKKADLDDLMLEWEKSIRENSRKDPRLNKLCAKYPLVILHSQRYAARLGAGYLRAAYSFSHETADQFIHQGDVQLLFDGGAAENSLIINTSVDSQNLLADLGEVDFAKDPDLKGINLDGNGVNSWDPKNGRATAGHVFVERVRDKQGNNFYVLFQVLAADRASRYTAFIWRFLPGAKVVKNP